MGIVTDVVLPIALVFIMLSLGLGLTFGDFARVAKQPRDFLVGAVSQVVLLPAVALGLVSIWPLAPELALGVMIIAAAPGGVTSNLLTAFGRGDVALSISLTAVLSLLSVVTVPLIVVFSYTHLVGGDLGDVSVAGAALGVFLIVHLARADRPRGPAPGRGLRHARSAAHDARTDLGAALRAGPGRMPSIRSTRTRWNTWASPGP